MQQSLTVVTLPHLYRHMLIVSSHRLEGQYSVHFNPRAHLQVNIVLIIALEY